MLGNVESVQVGPWSFNKSDREEVMPAGVQAYLVSVLGEWQKVFPVENTLAQMKFRVPSIFVRVDCSPNMDGSVGIYEIEERPAGVSLTRAVNPQFVSCLTQVEASWPEFGVVVSPRRGEPGTDDFLWKPVVDPDTYGGALLIRADPDETGFHRLGPRSISSLRTKGDKSYGEKLGWWHRVRTESDLTWEQGFCVKPMQSSKCRGLHVFPPRAEKLPGKSGNGSSTRSQVLKALAEYKEMYCQPYISPRRWISKDGVPYFEIWRAFFGFDTTSGRWLPLGGVWNAVPGSFRVHGGRSAVFGPLILS